MRLSSVPPKSQLRVDMAQNQMASKALYFGYGSNLQLGQMARRCPHSKFIGRAILHGYRWQINQRGYANVVATPSSHDAVQGLVYELDADDEARLDVNEGVAIGAYEKHYLDVELYRSESLCGEQTTWIVENGGPRKVSEEIERCRVKTQDRDALSIETMLVYLSTVYVAEGEPHDEYIERMRRGIEDGAALGIDANLYETLMGRYTFKKDGTEVPVEPESQPAKSSKHSTRKVYGKGTKRTGS